MLAESSQWFSNRLEHSQAMITLQIILAFIFGTAIGSFLNVLIWRLPRGQSIAGRSHCPHCNHQLSWFDLMPLLSILLQRAKCRYCSQPVSLRYPLIEAVTGVLFALAMWHFPIVDLLTTFVYVKIIIAIAICVIVFVVDLEHYLILDKVVLPAAAIMLVFAVVLDIVSGGYIHIWQSLLGALVAFVPFWLLWFGSRGKWMGFGDVKFVAFMGLALGTRGVIVALFASIMIGAITGLLLIGLGRKQLSSRLPFGTFLSVATVLALFWGNDLWNFYWRLFGVV